MLLKIRKMSRRSKLSTALAITMGLGASGSALAQSTTGSIFGTVSGATAGATVLAKGDNGSSREIPVDANGRYVINALPLGNYTVSLKRDGVVVATHGDVTLRVNAGTAIDFASDSKATNLTSVKVSAHAPTIDVSSVDSRMVVTAEQLSMLPLARSAEGIAMLAPGTVAGSPAFGNGNLVSFGGSSVAENAYYINGFNTSDPLKNLGGMGLPYGAISQEEVLTGGYSAMYGRSDGGVINQVGKSGTNEWHFGVQAQWTPRSLASDPENVYYATGDYKGQLYKYAKTNKSWTTTYSAYVGGPLIKDKLFIFLAAEAEKREGNTVGTTADSPAYNTKYQYKLPKMYGKLDWNINDSNLLEATFISSKEQYQGGLYNYDYDTKQTGSLAAYDQSHKTGGNVYIGKYTSYITDDLTLSVLYGISRLRDYYSTPGYDSTDPTVSNTLYEDPKITGGTARTSPQTTSSITDPNQGNHTRNLRVDLEYRLGDHRLKFGIDNQEARAIDRGSVTSGPGYSWYYGYTDPTTEINEALGVGAPGGDGYYVIKKVSSSSESVRTAQKAEYLEDNWQVSDRWLVNIGIRDDSFKNYNSDGALYVSQQHQWAPRLGFSWDVFGDATLKVFGNAGRYYLAMPNYVALAAASSSTATQQYYTYTGINANGVPTGLTQLSGVTSVNGNYGQAPDPKTVASTNLSSEYQDEFMLGFTKALGPDWIVGAKATYRVLRNAIDDVCDYNKIYDKAVSLGYDMSVAKSNSGCYLFNPGKTNDFLIATTNGTYYKVPMSSADFGFTSGVKRAYQSLELFAEHPLGGGRWGGKIDYIWSRSRGNTEGQVRSDRSQSSVSTTADWDYASIMSYANGTLANDRKHQIKANGEYRLSPEWMVSGVLSIASGAPKSCLGYYGTDQSNPTGYGSVYHWCDGLPSPPGASGRLEWTHKIDLSLEYRPAFAKHRLAFNVSVFNALNEQHALLRDSAHNSSSTTIYYLYNTIVYQEAPRSVRFGVNYDF